MRYSNIKRGFQKRTILLVLFLSSLSSPLFFYYLFDVAIPYTVTISLYAAWIVSLMLDMRITIQNRHLIRSHESNVVFRNIYMKFNAVTAILIQICIEVSFVFFMPFLFEQNNFTIDVQASSLIAAMVAVLHFTAWYHNKKTIKKIKNKGFI